MEKYKVRAIVEIEVLAKDGDPSAMGLDIDVSVGRRAEVVNVEWHLTEPTVVPYVAPESIGPWLHGAKEARFCEGGSTNVALVFPDDPGAWWWSNGHVMLRCDGAPPNGPRLVNNRTLAGTVVPELKRATIEWSAGGLVHDDTERVRFHRLKGDEVVCLSEKYFRLINSNAPDAWLVAGPTDPVHALKNGQLIAVAMPIRHASGDIVAERAA